MAKDNSPVGYTCGEIDDIIRFIKEATQEDVSISQAIRTLEDIRKANNELRKWGNEYYSRTEELEGELSEAHSEIERLRDELKYANQ